jgi:hypothetical protein
MNLSQVQNKNKRAHGAAQESECLPGSSSALDTILNTTETKQSHKFFYIISASNHLDHFAKNSVIDDFHICICTCEYKYFPNIPIL